MKRLNFFIPCVPPKASSQQKGVMVIGGKPRFFTKKKVADSADNLTVLLMQHRPASPLAGPLRLQLHLTFPWRKSESKRWRACRDRYCYTRPDADNIVKSYQDVMTRLLFWTDDGQVADLRVVKTWGHEPGIGVEIEELEVQQPAARDGGEGA